MCLSNFFRVSLRIVSIVFVLLFLSTFYVSASNQADNNASGSNEILNLMASSKIAGACGVLDSLIHFQKTTQLPGGDDFVVRFWNVEAARLGKSVKELSDGCNSAYKIYDTYWKIAESNSE